MQPCLGELAGFNKIIQCGRKDEVREQLAPKPGPKRIDAFVY